MSNIRCTAVKGFFASILSLGFFLHASGADAPAVNGAFEGKIFIDWSVTFTKSTTATGDDTTLVAHGFDNQRAYVGYQATFNEKFAGKVMLDVGRIKGVTSVAAVYDTTSDNTIVVKSVTTKTDDRFEAFLKLAYLEIKEFIPKTTLTFGMKGRNQFNIQEKFWGYRYLYKSLMDQEKFGSSADLGLGIKVSPVKLLEIYIDVENGEGYTKVQADTKYKSVLGVRLLPVEILDIYIYGDFMPDKDETKETQISVAGFVGVKPVKAFRIGAEYDFQKSSGGVKDSDLNAISAYASVKAKILDIFARFDLVSAASATVAPYEESKKVIIAGLQWSPVKNLKLAPNLQVTIPAGANPKPVTKILASGEFSF